LLPMQVNAAQVGYGSYALWAWSSGTGRAAVSSTGQANPWPAEMLLVRTAPRASTARRKYVPSYQNEIARKNKRFPRAKLAR
jgi:hypothetical protein